LVNGGQVCPLVENQKKQDPGTQKIGQQQEQIMKDQMILDRQSGASRLSMAVVLQLGVEKGMKPTFESYFQRTMKPTGTNFRDVLNLPARAALTLLLLAPLAGPARAQTISEAQPTTQWHGRAAAVTVSPWPQQFVVVASESGGLFQSRGGAFEHIYPFGQGPAGGGGIDFRKAFRMKDVKYGPAFPDGRPVILITTTLPDTSVTSAGGIWFSYDYGHSWAKANYGPSCNKWETAYGIAIDPVSGALYAGTDCGLAYSLDYGANWNLINPYPGGDSRVWSVVAQDGQVHVYGPSGHKTGIINQSSIDFYADAVAAPNPSPSVHGLAASPVESGLLFAAGADGAVYERDPQQRGPAWVQVSPVLHDSIGGRDGWVATSPSEDGTSFDIYYGAGENYVYRQTITKKGGRGPRCVYSGWNQIGANQGLTHKDPNGMGFTTQPGAKCPLFIATDGGIFGTSDCGANWNALGAGQNNGYNALQVYDMAGEMVSSGGYSHTELYLATQDNGLWASGDDGVTWPSTVGGDEFHTQVARYSEGPGHDNTFVLTFIGGYNQQAWPVARFNLPWVNPPPLPGFADKSTDNPTLLNWCLEHHVSNPFGGAWTANTYFQYTTPNGVLTITPNQAGTWYPAATNHYQWNSWGVPSSANNYNTIIYQPYARPDGPTIGLLRISGINADGTYANTEVKLADNGLESLGIYVAGEAAFDWRVVFAVDPQDPSHLIAPDIRSHSMKVSYDGGAHWTTDAGMQQLTQIVNGYVPSLGINQYQFCRDAGEVYNPPIVPGSYLQVTAIAFDPSHKDHILVGTETAGIIRSTDGGKSWTTVPKTENQVTAVSSFFFNDENSNPNQPNAEVWVATYGRGLWKITYPPLVGVGLVFGLGPDTLSQWDAGCWLRSPTGQCLSVTNQINLTNCPGCLTHVNVGGNITDLALDANGYLQSITTDTGQLVVSTPDGQPVGFHYPILSSALVGSFAGCPACSNLVQQGGHVRGLVLNHGQLVGVIGGSTLLPGETNIAQFSPAPGTLGDAPLADPPTNAYIQVIGTIAVGGQPTIRSGDTITVTGTGFCGPCDPVAITIGGPVLTNVTVAGDGSFQVSIPVIEPVGAYGVGAVQNTPSGALSDTRLLNVVGLQETSSEGAGPPVLAIQQQTNGLLITWSGDGYVLKSNTDLTSTGLWQQVPNSLIFNMGDVHAVVVQPIGAQAFYRLFPQPPPPPPAAVTLAASSVGTHGATLNGTVNGNGGDSAAWFVYGTTSNYDSSTSSMSISSADTNDTAVSMDIIGLQPGTLYHFQVVAANAGGTTYGADQTFITPYPPPDAVVQTFAASSVTSNSAVLGGSANPEGTVLVGWFQWGTTTAYGSNTPNFYNTTMNYQSVNQSNTITGLQPNTSYHYRIVAYNGGPDEALGNDVTFTTSAPFQPTPPTVTTFVATAVSNNAATFNGSVNPNGDQTYSYFEYGTNTYYGTTTAISDDGIGGTTLNLSYRVGSLSPNTTYHYRMVAYNSGGTTLGPDQIFTTASGQPPPTVNTLAASSVTNNSAILNGNVNPNGGDAHSYFEYGLDATYGSVTALSDVGSFNTPITLSYALILSPNTTYHYRIVAYNSGGTNYGTDVSFTTAASPPPPTVTTLAATSITTNAAILNASVNPNGFDTHAYFLYGLTTSYGNNTALVDVGAGSSSVPLSASVSLLPNTTYHFRAFAYSSAGTTYGQDMNFTSPP
jgi:hypothetical protein